MTLRLNSTLKILSVLIIAAALVSTPAFAEESAANPGPGMGTGLQGKGKHGIGRQGAGHGRHCKLEKNHRHKSCGKAKGDGAWRASLSPEQELQLDQLHVNYAKTKAPMKARIKALKVELAVLATDPQPHKGLIDAKIKELVELKGQLLGTKYGYIAAQRQALSPQQQVSFDMDVVHKVMHGKKERGHSCGGH